MRLQSTNCGDQAGGLLVFPCVQVPRCYPARAGAIVRATDEGFREGAPPWGDRERSVRRYRCGRQSAPLHGAVL